MTLHDVENAATFDTKAECLQWIDDRIVRFKLKMVPAVTTEGKATFVPQKVEGKIMNTTIESFENSGTDEPLSNYAVPRKSGDLWLAVMDLQ